MKQSGHRILWSKYVTRRLAIQVALNWNFGFGSAMKSVYGISVPNTLVFRDRKKTDYFVDALQHRRYVLGLYRLLSDDAFLKKFHRTVQKTLEKILKHVTDRIRQRNLSSYSNGELLRLYRATILPMQTEFYVHMWTVFNIGEPIANVILRILEKKLRNAVRARELLLEFASPLVPNDALCERIALLKLAIERRSLPKAVFRKRLEQHTRRYRHIPMYDYDHEPYASDHFLRELKAIRKPADELARLRQQFVGRRKKWTALCRSVQPDHHLKLLLHFLQENVFLRDYRDMIRQKLNLALREFYEEIGRRFRLAMGDVVMLTNDEICALLSRNADISSQELRYRNTACLLIQKGSSIALFSGNDAIAVARKELGVKSFEHRTRSIRGVVGSPGKAEGRAAIVLTNRDIDKVKEGDILITPMTRQDFVPAMRKAVALVTDEGSVTAHAAIIARELKIPCIVAARNATSIFRDGDRVSVDATKGVVTRL